MVYTVGVIPEKMRRVKRLWESHLGKVTDGASAVFTRVNGTAVLEPPPARPSRKNLEDLVCLLPGPVTISRGVRDAFHQPPIYHRGPEFIDRFVKVRHALGQMVGGRDVAILNGSGTLANEVIAATLATQRRSGDVGRGVMLINGEFGERLSRQATRFGLEPRVLQWAWGEPWDLEEIEGALAREPKGGWVWGVHQESSTGVLNNLPGLVSLAKKYGQRVCVDCISSLGAVPIDLSEVYLASGASGKSLGSYAGASLIFADREALSGLDRRHIPSYFDLYGALVNEGPCYTFPSPTLLALEAALTEFATPSQAQAIYARYHEMGVRVRQHLRRLGLTPLAREEYASPVITTFAPAGEESSQAFVQQMQSWGFAVGGESGYLSCRRLVQIATMGAVRWDTVAPLFDHLESHLAKKAFLAGV
jgi:aspartate aminotransferase-like enzyme